MPRYSADPDALTSLAVVVGDATTSLSGSTPPAASTLLSNGYVGEAFSVAAILSAAETWLTAWMRSLVDRAAILDRTDAVMPPSGPASRRSVLTDQIIWAVAGAPTLERRTTVYPTDPAALAEFVATLPFAADEAGGVVGEFLARQVAGTGDMHDMADVAGLVDRFINSPAAAAAFFAALDPGHIAAMTALAGLASFDTAAKHELMAPFANALALASRSGSFDIDPAAFASGQDAAYWFIGDGYGRDFLLAALVAALQAEAGWRVWATDELVVDGQVKPADPRVAILVQLARFGGGISIDVVAAVGGAALLDEFVDPRGAYPDGGEAVGQMLARLGAEIDARSAALVVDVMTAIATSRAPSEVLQGAGRMVLPHVGSLATGAAVAAIAGTPLRDALFELVDPSRVIRGFLDAVMRDDAAAKHVLAGFSLMLAAAVTSAFDPSDATSVAIPYGASGLVLDSLLDAKLEATLADARSNDAHNRLLDGILSVVVDFVVARGLEVLRIEGVRAAVAGAAGSWAADQRLASFADGGLDTDQAEHVLEDGYAIEAEMVDGANWLLAVLLHDAGLIELPEHWLPHGQPMRPPREVWEAFVVELEAGGFPFFEWFNHPASLGGYADFVPEPEH